MVDLALVLAVAALTTWANLAWAASDTGSPVSDAATHAFQSLLFHDELDRAGPDLVLQALLRWTEFRGHYPPLAYQVGELGWLLLGRSTLAPVLGQAPFLVLLAGSMYGLGRLLAGRLAGLAAAIMACTAPVVLDHSRMLFLDMPLTALVAFGTWSLLASRSFEDVRLSRCWGLALGLGLLTKWTFLLFLAVPWMTALGTAFLKRGPGSLQQAVRMLLPALILALVAALCFPLQSAPFLAVWALALLCAVLQVARVRRGSPAGPALVNGSEALILAVALAAPYYLANQDMILHKVFYQAEVQVDIHLTAWLNLYEQSLWLSMTAPWWPLGAMLGLARRQTRSVTLQLLASVILNTAFYSMVPHDPRYLMPNLPALVAVSLNVVRGAPAIGVVVLVATAAVGAIQAGSHLPRLQVDWPTLQDRRGGPSGHLPWRPPLPTPPRTEPYHFHDVLERLGWGKPTVETVVMVAGSPTESVFLQPRALAYYAELRGRKLQIREVANDRPEGDSGTDVTDYLLVYRHPTASRQGTRLHLKEGPITRESLLNQAIAQRDFPKGLKTVRVFRFGRYTAVELLKPGHRQGQSGEVDRSR